VLDADHNTTGLRLEFCSCRARPAIGDRREQVRPFLLSPMPLSAFPRPAPASLHWQPAHGRNQRRRHARRAQPVLRSLPWPRALTPASSSSAVLPPWLSALSLLGTIAQPSARRRCRAARCALGEPPCSLPAGHPRLLPTGARTIDLWALSACTSHATRKREHPRLAYLETVISRMHGHVVIFY
jgi:hypothetical protein